MHTIFTLLISAFSFNSFALDSTYLQSYGVKDSFASRSDLIKKSWAETDVLTINNTELPVAYNNMLRYAFASSYAYRTKQGADPF